MKPIQRQKAAIDRLVGHYAAKIKVAGAYAYQEVFEFKVSTPAEALFRAFPRLFEDPQILNAIHGEPFPQSVEKLFSISALGRPAQATTELLWAICRALQHAEKLGQFIALREKIENAFLTNSSLSAEDLINRAEIEFGQSIWLIQNRLSAEVHWKGIENVSSLSSSITKQLSPKNVLATILVNYITRRTAATSRIDFLRAEFDRFLERQHLHEIPTVKAFLSAKLFELHDIRTDDVASLLFFEAQSSLIDHYESLIAVLQTAATDDTIPLDVAKFFAVPLTVLSRKVNDKRLNGVLRALGIPAPINSEPLRALAIEAYSKGEYIDAIHYCGQHLVECPDDLPISVLKVQASVNGSIELERPPGIVGEIQDHLLTLFKTSHNAYEAAYALLTISDRFYGQMWSIYLRAVVTFEVRPEQVNFPSLQLRRIYVLDPRTSPFSRIASTREALASINLSKELGRQYPTTDAIWNAARYGKESNRRDLAETRLRRYQAFHYLSQNQPQKADVHFRWLLENEQGAERLRIFGGAALSLCLQKRPSEAAKTIVDAYVENSTMPGVLPIAQVAKTLWDPESWDHSICIPILFELYTAYMSRDGMTQLRYSFETLIISTGVSEPVDFVSAVKELPLPYIILFLDKVWRPDVMKQTILYASTRDIEETRVKVCKLLAELDPKNSHRYLDEVKERVKHLSISKATTLIDQSKVHVDVGAIQRALKKKLGDSYARYKSSARQTEDSKSDDVIYKLAQAISDSMQGSGQSVSSLLSKLHVIDGLAPTETDMQFSSLYSEIQNEFLRGDHGLNAYLSTCVRHGTLSNTLRKAVSEEHLVNAQLTNGQYLPNNNWPSIKYSEFKSEWAGVNAALTQFTESFDLIIAKVRDRLLQIRLLNDPTPSKDNEALFVYFTSNVEKKYIQAKVGNSSDMDDLVSISLDRLLEKTDENLITVQDVLNKNVREEITKAFNDLEITLSGYGSLHGVGELNNAVARARTSTFTRFATVVSWFKRSEVYDRQDYLPDFPAQIALNMIRNTMAGPTDASFTSSLDGQTLPGRTLDAMVYIFYDLFSNARQRAGLTNEFLDLNVHITFEAGHLRAAVSNKVDLSTITPDDRAKVDKIREQISSGDNSQAQVDKNSGLKKIWVALNSSQLRDQQFTFGFLDDRFVVDFSVRLTGKEHEDTIH